ncbi:tRNA uracil 4-sulfurtransferase ThiI [Mycoplasmopsis hyopharyngis]|uniref:tRNA uracil 4-sulfurtransferase ThiI n=1 Tax=Mycoplasmopsis hyopharyngis TaxID=29558 RepID=UPI0038730D82
MYKKILIRYGELVLKKKNRNTFTTILANNIKAILNTKPEVEFDRMFVDYSEDHLNKLMYVFGISSFSPVAVIDKDIEQVKEQCLKMVDKNTKTFKISTHRNDKSFSLNSNQINCEVGSFIVEKANLAVDVHNPDQVFFIEIRKNNIYIFSKYHYGLGGLPVGSSGKTLHLLSGGIDSPVAAFNLMKRGLKVEFLSFITPPQTDSKTIDKIHSLIKVLNLYQVHSVLHLVNYSHLMNYIALVSKPAYKITLMRRSFYRIAEKIAIKYKIPVLSNGDNLGQVASQTLESLATISEATRMQIFRPLLTNDKEETIKIAKRIGTYDISILKANETCELFAPKEPVTKPTVEQVIPLEKELQMLEELEKECVDNLVENIKF